MITALDEQENGIEVAVSSAITKKKMDDNDPFNASFQELKGYESINRLTGGSFSLDKNFIRRSDRRIQKDFTGQGKSRSKQINIEEITGYTYLDCILPPYNLEYLAKLYSISPAHRAAVNAKVESVFGLGYDWIESPKTALKRSSVRTDGGLNKLENILASTKVQLEEWLESTNNEDTFEEVMRKIGIDYESTGNAYMEIGRTSNGKIGYIGHVPAPYVRVRKDRDGFIQIFSNQVVYFRNFAAKNPNTVTDDPNPNELIHFYKYSPEHTYYGVPDIMAAQNALAGNEFASRYNLDYFENKAIPRHVIIMKGADLTTRSKNRLVEFFEAGLRGQHHRSIYIPLPKSTDGKSIDIEFKDIETGQQDFSFGAYRESNNEEIFMAHRVPATRAGVFSGKIALAAAQEADKVFKESYSGPEQAIFEKKMKRVFSEVTDMYIFQLNELSLTDANTQSQIDERDVRNQIKVPDEVRAQRGMRQRPDGKGQEPFAPTTQQAADQRANAAESRSRDADRSANQSDGKHGKGRMPKGNGRRTE